jgi:hypothetical protein
MGHIEVRKPVGIAISVAVVALMIGAIWWRTGMQVRNSDPNAQAVIAAQEVESLRQRQLTEQSAERARD